MQRFAHIRLLAWLFLLLWLPVGCAEAPASPADVVRQAEKAMVEGYNARDLSKFDQYFATPNQGADPNGLALTQAPVHDLMDQAGPKDLLDVLSFDVTNEQVDETHKEATVHYRAEASIKAGDFPTQSNVVEQDVALMKVNGRWLISGGDKARLSPLPSQSQTPVP